MLSNFYLWSALNWTYVAQGVWCLWKTYLSSYPSVQLTEISREQLSCWSPIYQCRQCSVRHFRFKPVPRKLCGRRATQEGADWKEHSPFFYHRILWKSSLASMNLPFQLRLGCTDQVIERIYDNFSLCSVLRGQSTVEISASCLWCWMTKWTL